MLRLILALGLMAMPAGAECRLALALAVDVSRSVSITDFRIQTVGLVEALRDPRIRQALLVPPGEVALAVFQWSGDSHQDLVQPWIVIGSEADLATVIASVEAAQRPEVAEATALGWALVYARDLFDAAPTCAARVLDVAGDGRNNIGISAASAYRRADYAGITVNGLAIGEHESDLEEYYRAEVIRGLGAFVEAVPRQEDYPRAIRRKLLRELTGPLIGGVPVAMGSRG